LVIVGDHCPVCQARFRGARACSRCGADLERLMRMAAEAWRLRQAARAALDCGDVERALTLASEAQRVRHTPRGEAVRLLSAWLVNRDPAT
jgi:predicted amidophosphoribosyltransferase